MAFSSIPDSVCAICPATDPNAETAHIFAEPKYILSVAVYRYA